MNNKLKDIFKEIEHQTASTEWLNVHPATPHELCHLGGSYLYYNISTPGFKEARIFPVLNTKIDKHQARAFVLITEEDKYIVIEYKSLLRQYIDPLLDKYIDIDLQKKIKDEFLQLLTDNNLGNMDQFPELIINEN